jgi:hypothetical protein
MENWDFMDEEERLSFSQKMETIFYSIRNFVKYCYKDIKYFIQKTICKQRQ